MKAEAGLTGALGAFPTTPSHQHPQGVAQEEVACADLSPLCSRTVSSRASNTTGHQHESPQALHTQSPSPSKWQGHTSKVPMGSP